MGQQQGELPSIVVERLDIIEPEPAEPHTRVLLCMSCGSKQEALDILETICAQRNVRILVNLDESPFADYACVQCIFVGGTSVPGRQEAFLGAADVFKKTAPGICMLRTAIANIAAVDVLVGYVSSAQAIHLVHTRQYRETAHSCTNLPFIDFAEHLANYCSPGPDV